MKVNFLTYVKWLAGLVMGVFFFASCNKENLEAIPVEAPAATGQTLAQLISDPSFSVFKAAVTKAGLLASLDSGVYTVFAPDDAALARAGINATVVGALPVTTVAAIVQYHIVGGQKITSSMIPSTFPNMQLPTQLVLAPPSTAVPPGLRMSLFPSKRGALAWANNIPLTAVDIQAKNGVLHKTATVLIPPQQFLWERIVADNNLNYLEAAIRRADEATPSPGLVAGLSNPAANLTVFAPNDAAMQQFLVGSIAQALIAKGLAPLQAQGAASALVTAYGTTIISNPASIPDAPIFPTGTGIGAQLANVLTPTTIAGLVAYHVLGTRAFTINLPTADNVSIPTLLTKTLSTATVDIKATFNATGSVSAATVKGKANTTPSNIQINPAGNGSSDQLYINGILHVIDQVLRPQ